MINVARFPEPNSSSDGDPPDARTAQTLALINTLIDSLPEQIRDRLKREFADELRSADAPRAGEVLGTIIRLLPKKKDWSVAELKQQVDDRGVEATDKEIYNAIGYLARKGQMRRIGYGRYYYNGVVVEGPDDFGGESARHEDAYRVDRETE
jgi:hypothetical protein